MLQHRMLAFEVRQASAGGADPLMQKVMHLCRARGIVFQCSEIYGGLANAFDFGPLGVTAHRRGAAQGADVAREQGRR